MAVNFDEGPLTYLQLYTKADVYVNSSLLAEETSITISRDTNSQPIHTLAIGYAGEAAGSPLAEIVVDSAVPSTTFEMDPGRFMNGLQEIQFSIFAANQILTFNGFITSDNFAHAVNTESKLTFKARGTFTQWEQT